MVIQIDTREKARAIKTVLAQFDEAGINHISSKLYVGDFQSLDNPKVIIDRKRNIAEICGNVSHVPKKDKDGKVKRYADGAIMCEYERFTREIQKAVDVGIHIIFLIEDSKKYKKLEDVNKWKNPRLAKSPLCISGQRLYKLLFHIQQKYGVEFQFCDKAHTGKKIIEILGGGESG